MPFTTQGLNPLPDSSRFLVAQPVRHTGSRSAAIILMATDGTPRSDSALRVAAARAHETGATLELMIVLGTELVFNVQDAEYSDATLRRWTLTRKSVEQQIERALGRDAILSVTVLAGNPAYTISRMAIERRAAVVVVGLGRHQLTQRLLGDETALQLARIARVPVLAVPTNVDVAPRHAVVAIDFSEISTRAAQSAIEAIGDNGRVDLVHVTPPMSDGVLDGEAHETYERWAREQLASVEALLVVPSGVTVTRVALRGWPAPALLNYVTAVGADLIATGTHGKGFVARAIIGSVTTKLMRSAHCALLTAPRDPLPALAPTAQDALAGDTFDAPLSWSSLLNDFTRRNAGRRTILEVDDLEIGAQAQEYNYPLLGASYSDRDGRVNLMLGDRAAGGRHLSRTMGSVVAVDVITDGAGHDVALRVQHGTNQTLMTFMQSDA